MKIGPIDSSRIEAMAAQMRAAAARQTAPTTSAAPAASVSQPSEGVKVSFSAALKAMLDQVNAQQMNADQLSKRFAMGDTSLNLSDVMIERQKASLAMTATVQVRNKLVNAYQEIMNMAV